MSALSELESKYNEVTTLYDLAEDLVETAESELLEDIESQLELVEPLIAHVGDAADILCEEFCKIAGNPRQMNQGSSKKIESALRKIFTALEDYQQRLQKQAERMKKQALNLADPIVEKIRRQVETIIAIFIDFVDISLERIMHKAAIEELKRRQEKISLMLHSMAQNAV